jgi:hypothetical protein
VSGAGTAPVARAATDESHDYAIAVTARSDTDGVLDAKELAATLRLVGAVDDVEELGAEAGPGLRAVVVVSAPDANVAVGAVLSAVHESDALLGTEITYDLGS